MPVSSPARGALAESLCCWFLRLKGYRILARNFRSRGGEIDIVARDKKCLVFVEVKARPDLARAAHAIRPRQRRRILTAGRVFMATFPAHAGDMIRFDALLVAPWRLPQHIKDAWREDGL